MRLVILATILSMGLLSCGQQLCLGPFGNCYSATAAGGAGTQLCGTYNVGIDIQVPTAYINRHLIPVNPGTITLTAINGTGGYIWQTTPPGLIGAQTGAFPTAALVANTNYIVTVTDNSGASVSISFTTGSQ